ncbi:putative rRNA maturation factor [Hasllibacter halocynthiae]|uniref:Endoribonuclease YbeY n=1 Tax=Hasllibacter halocynthiae TaxID=595589 RepID=A0A2T0X158_9RHOB|nr:rRNA maturation RNase YbeY [Hasllibacter halocynthiae]PRY92657.1 putative rRNA maturation factor [Hasllibacter halocynthiae]
MTVDVMIEDPRWAGLPAIAEPAVQAALEGLGLDPDDHDVALLGCDDARIAALNARFRRRDGPTNVLSFPAADLAPGETPPEEMGDVAIAWDTCAREAEAQGKPFEAHVAHLVVHAVLHLAGHDHDSDGEARLMERLERRILAGMGVPDPYRDGAGAPDEER